MSNSKKNLCIGLCLLILLVFCSKPGKLFIKSCVVHSCFNIAKELSDKKMYKQSNYFYTLAQKVSSTTIWVDYFIARNIRSAYWNKPLTPEKKANLNLALKHLDIDNKKHPNDAYITQEYGFVYQQLEEFDKAIEYYEKSLDINPKLEYSYEKLSYIYCNMKFDYETALKYQDKKMEIHIDEGFYGDYFNKAFILSHLERHEEAVKYYKKYLTYHPTHVGALVNIAGDEIAIGEYDSALNHINKGLKIAPAFSYLWNLKVTVLLHKHEFEDAKKISIALLKEDYYNYDSYWHLAEISRYEENFEQADKYYNQAKKNAQEYYTKYCQNPYDIGDYDGKCGNRYLFLKDFDKNRSKALTF